MYPQNAGSPVLLGLKFDVQFIEPDDGEMRERIVHIYYHMLCKY